MSSRFLFAACVLLMATAGCNPKDKQHLKNIGRKLHGKAMRALPAVSRTLDGTWDTLHLDVPGGGASRVAGRLRTDKLLANAKIEVTSAEPGRVTLTGTVENDTARQRAKLLAESTVGVEGVEDQLTVAPPAGPKR